MTEEKITEMLLMNESLAEDVRALTYKVADLTETVEILTRIISAELKRRLVCSLDLKILPLYALSPSKTALA